MAASGSEAGRISAHRLSPPWRQSFQGAHGEACGPAVDEIERASRIRSLRICSDGVMWRCCLEGQKDREQPRSTKVGSQAGAELTIWASARLRAAQYRSGASVLCFVTHALASASVLNE